MATLTDWIKQMNQIGAVNNSAPNSTRKSPMELMIMQQAMGQKADADNLAGFAFGKLLRGLFDDWKERYDARGLLNDINAIEDPNKRTEAFANLEKNNPRQYQIAQGYMNNPNSKWAGLQQTPEVSGINSNARAVQKTTGKLLGDTDFLGQTWREDENWNKWGNLLNGVGWQNGLRF